MHLYRAALQSPTAVTCLCAGHFLPDASPYSPSDLALAHGQALRLLTVPFQAHDGPSAHLVTQSLQDLGAPIRALCPVPRPPSSPDAIALTTVAGELLLMAYDAAACAFVTVARHRLGPPGARRTVPGQYVACAGGDLLCAALTERLVAFPVAAGLGPPAEARAPGGDVHYAVEAAGAGRFAVLCEAGGGAGGKALVVYARGPGGLRALWRAPQPATSHALAPAPAPVGVLVCAAGQVAFWACGAQPPDGAVPAAPVPRRAGAAAEGLLVACAGGLRQRGFALVQTEEGDVWRVQVTPQGTEAAALSLAYFDTVPLGVGMGVLRSGFLFLAAESGDHRLYQMAGLGATPERALLDRHLVVHQGRDEVGRVPLFAPTTSLTNLRLVDMLVSYAPLVCAAKVPTVGPGQLCCLSGRGPASKMRLLQYGLRASVAAELELQEWGTICNVWALKQRLGDATHRYIVVALENQTLYFAVDGEDVQQIQHLGAPDVKSLAWATLTNGCLVQVWSGGVNYIRPDSDRGTQTWNGPGIQLAAVNGRQLVVVQKERTVVYFELDASDNWDERGTKTFADEVKCLDVLPLLPTADGKEELSPFVALAFINKTLSICSIAHDFREVAAVPLSSVCFELRAVPLPPPAVHAALYLSVYSEKGTHLTVIHVEPRTGALSLPHSRTLPVPLRLYPTRMHARAAVLCVGGSDRMWLCHRPPHGLPAVTPVACAPARSGQAPVGAVAPFAWAAGAEALLVARGGSLLIQELHVQGPAFTNPHSDPTAPLRCTPRALVPHPELQAIAVLTGDDATAPVAEADGQAQGEGQEPGGAVKRAPQGTWCSYVSVYDATGGRAKATHTEELAGWAVTRGCAWRAGNGRVLLVVGACRERRVHPPGAGEAKLFCFLWTPGGLQLQSEWPCPGMPLGMQVMGERLLVAIGAEVVVYELRAGSGALVQVQTVTGIPHTSRIVCTDVIDRHLFVADARQSVSVLSLAAPGHWRVLGQSLEPRPATCMRCLDPVTVCVADKFGGVQILRLPPVSDVPLQAPVRGPGGAFEMDTGGVAVLQPVASLNVGSVVMSVEKLTLSHAADATEVILYATITGAMGILGPLRRADVPALQALEHALRRHQCSASPGPAPLQLHVPCGVIDGEHLAAFAALEPSQSQAIATSLPPAGLEAPVCAAVTSAHLSDPPLGPAHVLRFLEDVTALLF